MQAASARTSFERGPAVRGPGMPRLVDWEHVDAMFATLPSAVTFVQSGKLKALVVTDEKRWPARVLANMIDGWKNRGLTPDQVQPGEGAAYANGRGLPLYKAYQARLKTLNAADFGDLLIEMLRLFREHAEVLRQYQERFRYVLVDEYQDTNVAQYLWLRLLGQSTARAAKDGANATALATR
jgi:superfamily I DNA/RNA helicase